MGAEHLDGTVLGQTEEPLRALPVIDAEILESPILWTFLLTVGLASCAYVVGGRAAADKTAILVPAVALTLAAIQRLVRREAK